MLLRNERPFILQHPGEAVTLGIRIAGAHLRSEAENAETGRAAHRKMFPLRPQPPRAKAASGSAIRLEAAYLVTLLSHTRLLYLRAVNGILMISSLISMI